jgi:cysteine synthase A
MIKNNTLDLILQTPLLKLDRISNAEINLYGKLEFLQPGGSIKDRAAFQIIKDAYAIGKLKKGQTVVEMTSGNMGAGLAIVCKQFGNSFTAFMSEGNSPERIKMLKALGAEVILTKQIDGVLGKVTGNDIKLASKLAEEYAKENDCFYVDQFNNQSSVDAHYLSTGPEILKDLPEIDAFVASIGTGGTFIGTSKYLKERKAEIKCIAVEPESASILKTGKVTETKHIIQGTGYGLIPPHWEKGLPDEIITVTDEEVKDMTKHLSTEQGVFVGYSSGANVVASLKYAALNKNIKNIVTILCDTGFKYSNL